MRFGAGCWIGGYVRVILISEREGEGRWKWDVGEIPRGAGKLDKVSSRLFCFFAFPNLLDDGDDEDDDKGFGEMVGKEKEKRKMDAPLCEIWRDPSGDFQKGKTPICN